MCVILDDFGGHYGFLSFIRKRLGCLLMSDEIGISIPKIILIDIKMMEKKFILVGDHLGMWSIMGKREDVIALNVG